MVVDPYDYHLSVVWGSDFFHKWIRFGALYLHLILMTREKALETIVVLALGAIVLSFWLEVDAALYVAVGLLSIAVISRSLTWWIGKVWLGFSHYFGMVMNTVIMFVLFYMFLFPISLFQKLFGGNQILKKKEGSYFHKREYLFTIRDIEKPW